MIWSLSKGENIISFHGREPDTKLDKVRLVKINGNMEYHWADKNNNREIETIELIDCIELWARGEGTSLKEILEIIKMWKGN